MGELKFYPSSEAVFWKLASEKNRSIASKNRHKTTPKWKNKPSREQFFHLKKYFNYIFHSEKPGEGGLSGRIFSTSFWKK